MFCARLLGIIYIGIILMTTFATQTNADTEELPVVLHECGEETLCSIKPPDYPQEEIDEMAFKYLRHLNRTKRAAEEESASPEEGGNCATETTNSPVYTARDSSRVPFYLVQSKWFTQGVKQVKCKNEKSSCFTEVLVPGAKPASCITNCAHTSLIIFDQVLKKPATIQSRINIGCDCVLN